MVARAVDNEAPYFVDYVGDALDTTFPGVVAKPGALDIYTTLDLNLQRYAQDAVRAGIASVDAILARRKRGPQRVAQAALVAVDPRIGRDPRVHRRPLVQPVAVQSRRRGAAADRIDVQAVRLSRRVRKGGRRGHRRHHAGDDRLRRADDVELRQPGVVAEELRRRVRRRDHAAARAGDVAQHRHDQGRRTDRLRSRRRAVEEGQGRQHRSGEALPVGRARHRRADAARSRRGVHGVPESRHAEEAARRSSTSPAARTSPKPKVEAGPNVARPSTAFLVTHMMRSVLNEGTGAGARGNGFTPMPPASRARPTICATRGSSASRRSCSPWCGSASTTTSRSA